MADLEAGMGGGGYRGYRREEICPGRRRSNKGNNPPGREIYMVAGGTVKCTMASRRSGSANGIGMCMSEEPREVFKRLPRSSAPLTETHRSDRSSPSLASCAFLGR